MAPAGTLFFEIFTFLLIIGVLDEKEQLSTWPNMVWKAFLLFCDLCQSSQVAMYSICIKMALPVPFFHFLVVVGIQIKKKEA